MSPSVFYMYISQVYTKVYLFFEKNNNCLHDSDPSNNPRMTNFASITLDYCNGLTFPNPPLSNGLVYIHTSLWRTLG